MLVSSLYTVVSESWVRREKKRLLRYTQKVCKLVKSERVTHCTMYSTIRFTCE